MKKQLGSLVLASSMAMAGVANAAPQAAGPEVTLGGCTLDHYAFAMRIMPTAYENDTKRADFAQMRDMYLHYLQQGARSTVEDYTAKQSIEIPSLDHLSFVLNDITYKFNKIYNTNFNIRALEIDAQPHPHCKTMPRLHPKP